MLAGLQSQQYEVGMLQKAEVAKAGGKLPQCEAATFSAVRLACGMLLVSPDKTNLLVPALQMAPSRSHVYTFGPKVGSIDKCYIH